MIQDWIQTYRFVFLLPLLSCKRVFIEPVVVLLQGVEGLQQVLLGHLPLLKLGFVELQSHRYICQLQASATYKLVLRVHVDVYRLM